MYFTRMVENGICTPRTRLALFLLCVILSAISATRASRMTVRHAEQASTGLPRMVCATCCVLLVCAWVGYPGDSRPLVDRQEHCPSDGHPLETKFTDTGRQVPDWQTLQKPKNEITSHSVHSTLAPLQIGHVSGRVCGGPTQQVRRDRQPLDHLPFTVPSRDHPQAGRWRRRLVLVAKRYRYFRDDIGVSRLHCLLTTIGVWGGAWLVGRVVILQTVETSEVV